MKGYENLRKLRHLRLRETIAEMANPNKNFIRELNEDIEVKGLKVTKLHQARAEKEYKAYKEAKQNYEEAKRKEL